MFQPKSSATKILKSSSRFSDEAPIDRNQGDSQGSEEKSAEGKEAYEMPPTQTSGQPTTNTVMQA
jgi:hypothetical protein